MILQTAAEPTISLPDQLDDLQLGRCAELVFEAGRGYYDLIEAERSIVEDQIRRQLGQPGTELQNIFVALIDSNVAGLHACISSEVLPFVMMEGTLRLLRGFERGVRRSFLSRLQRARPFLPALPESSLYLARMAVSESYQGLGIALVLMEDFFGRRDFNGSYCLHCLTDNSRALDFYGGLGFEPFGEAMSGFLAMHRAAN